MRIASGVYETEDRVYYMYRCVDVYPPAWNVERMDGEGEIMIVDGARTMRDAIAIFGDRNG